MKIIKNLIPFLVLLGEFFLQSCGFISSFVEQPDKNISLNFDKSKASVSIGAMDVINLTASSDQNSANIEWLYDSNIIMAKTDNYSAIITGLQPGTSTLTAICGSNSASCVVEVTNETYAVTVTNPYVYASSDYINVSRSNTVKVSAALFGGSASDINGFTWSIDKPQVASIVAEGNYCWVSGLNDGIAKLTVKHNKAAYPYSIIVNCNTDGTDTTYITTENNIITVNLSEESTSSFSVDLVNSPYQDYSSGFEYKIVDALGNEFSSNPVSITGVNGLDVSFTAYEEGNCYIRCSHPAAIYSLDILVRVIKNAETAFIEPSKTFAIVSDTEYEEILVNLENYSGDVDSEKFKWTFSEGAEEYIDYSILNGSSSDTGDRINVKGKKNGSVKITVTYPGVSSRNIVILVRDIKTEAADATVYITTSQNYVLLSMEDEPKQISITLTNADTDSVNDLNWKITNSALDGSSSNVIDYVQGTGTVSSRAVIQSSSNGYCIIKPVNPGTAYIDISHPKALYSTRITVVVTEKKAVAVNKTYLSFASPAVVTVKNGESVDIKVSLQGDGSEDDIVWSSEGNITASGNGTVCNVSAPAEGSGGSKNTVTVTHPESESKLIFNIVCYDTEEELNEYNVKSIFSYTTSAKINTEQSFTFYLETLGFEESPEISWSVKEGSSCIDFYTENGNKELIVTGRNAGYAVLTASADGCDDVNFFIDIEDARIIEQGNPCYLSTYSNVVYFNDIGESHDIQVSLFNIDSLYYSEIEWTLSDNSGFDVVANGNTATVSSLASQASGVLTVTHPLSENSLDIYLKTGNQFEYVNEDCPYISTNKDVFELFAGQEEVSLIATLNHTEESDSEGVVKGFTFSIDDESVAEISYVNYSNTCYIKPLKNGTTKILVRHPDSQFEKEVIVIVSNPADFTKIPYLSTLTNVITVIQGEYVTASAQLMNCNLIDNSAWHWKSEDSKIADVIANNGTSALLCANAPGTVEIKVTHDECLYSLKILVTVLDASVVSDKPYIYTSTNILTIKKGSGATLTAQMIGGSSANDSSYFKFTLSNPSMIVVSPASGSAYVRALNEGLAYITVYNTRYSESYSKTVLVVIEDTQEDNVYISVSNNILKIKPDSSDMITVSAELVNGLPTDAEDFIWWADDYNLVNLTAIASKCSVIPTGRSGTTKIHIKHAKAEKQADILCMISNYDAFSFSSSSANITTDKLYFFPLQIPAIEEEFTVQYSSTNENVCIISGSDYVAWVCGMNYGTASLTASMVSKDGTVIASTQMLVSVNVIDPVVPVISLGDTIITVDEGTSKVISAILSGEDIDPNEKYNLKWSIQNNEKGISLLDENADGIVYGPDVYASFDTGGEYVISCEHELSGARADLYIKVLEKEEMDIELNSNLETVYKDDGSFTLTATLINGTEADYKNIEWSALKVGGLSIVAVSKSNGASCTVTPKAVGQTTVFAKLPNGQTASCIVVVKASTEITFDLGSVHVIPGYTEVINYRTKPENATINWYAQMTTSSSDTFGSSTNYFSWEDDTAKKQLRVTGLRECPDGVAGTISAIISGGTTSVPSVKVYVNYDVELRLEDLNGSILTKITNINPDTANVKSFNIVYYPTDLDIDIKLDDSLIACIPSEGNTALHSKDNVKNISVSVGDVKRTLFTEEGTEKCRMTVDLVPHTECEANITVSATLPSDSKGLNSVSKNFYYSAFYEDYDIEIVNLTEAAGAFTEFPPTQNGNINQIILGDGEEAVFYFKIKNENAAGKITSCSYEPVGSLYFDYIMKSPKYWQSNVNKTRREKAKEIFKDKNITDNTELSLIQANNYQPGIGLIDFYDEANSSTGITVYHLSHNWDYYKDLPKDLTDEGDGWEAYKEKNNYSNDFFKDLDVDYWLVSQEMTYKGKYALQHSPSVKVFSVNWIKTDGQRTTVDRDPGYVTYSKKDSVKLLFDNNQVAYFIAEKRGTSSYSYNQDFDFDENSDCTYKTCVPYVITKNELIQNKALVRPDNCTDIKHNEWTVTFIGNTGTDWTVTAKLPKLFAKGITPTVQKCTKEEGTLISGKGQILINYKKGNGIAETHTIGVQIKKYPCEAYTNNSWTKQSVNGNKRWVLDEK